MKQWFRCLCTDQQRSLRATKTYLTLIEHSEAHFKCAGSNTLTYFTLRPELNLSEKVMFTSGSQTVSHMGSQDDWQKNAYFRYTENKFYRIFLDQLLLYFALPLQATSRCLGSNNLFVSRQAEKFITTWQLLYTISLSLCFGEPHLKSNRSKITRVYKPLLGRTRYL